MNAIFNAAVAFAALQGTAVGAFLLTGLYQRPHQGIKIELAARKGFGNKSDKGGSEGGFGGVAKSPSSTKKRKKLADITTKGKKATTAKSQPTATNSFQEAAARNPAEAKRILQLYGGDIQEGTIRRMNEARAKLAQSNPLLDEAMKLTEDQKKWERSTKGMSLLQQSEIPSQQWEVEKVRKKRLKELVNSHGITEPQIHNAFQRLTWDASADARAFRGNADLSNDMQSRLDTALKYAIEPVLNAGEDGRILDVGCGTGYVVGELKNRGVRAQNIVGIDISPEMTRVASEAWPGVTFVTGDFFSYSPDNPLSTVLFCMAIHDLPKPMLAIEHASSFLSPGGRIVVSHPRGSEHVLMQHRRNPIMVPHTLPTVDDLTSICEKDNSLSIILEPSEPGDRSDIAEGYLCILEKKRQ